MQEKIINNVTLVKYGIIKGIDTEICKRGVQVIETYKNKSIFIRILKRLKRNFKIPEMCTSFCFVLLSAEGPTRKDLRAVPAGIKKERINGRKGSFAG